MTKDENQIENYAMKYVVQRDLIIIAVILIVLIAFRSTSVGLDTEWYCYLYQTRDHKKWIATHSGIFRNELGFQYLQLMLRTIKADFHVLTFIEAIIYIVPVMTIVYRYSKNPYYSVFMFFAFDYYLFGMTAMRQTIAIGIVMIALLMALEDKPLYFYLLVMFAALFHITSVVALPIYIMTKIPLQKKYMVVSIVAGLGVFVFKGQIQKMIRSFARIDYGNLSTGGTGMYIFMFSMIVLDLLLFDEEDVATFEIESVFRYMLITAVLIYPVLQFNPSAFRLHFYYSIAMIIYLPNILEKIRFLPLGHIITAGYTAISLYYMFTYTFHQLGAVPYHFF